MKTSKKIKLLKETVSLLEIAEFLKIDNSHIHNLQRLAGRLCREITHNYVKITITTKSTLKSG